MLHARGPAAVHEADRRARLMTVQVTSRRMDRVKELGDDDMIRVEQIHDYRGVIERTCGTRVQVSQPRQSQDRP